MRVFIAADSPVTDACLTVTLSQVRETVIVGRAAVVAGAEEDIEKLKPDVVILGARAVGNQGLKMLRGIKQADKAPAVVVLAGECNAGEREQWRSAGADFCLDMQTEYEKMEQLTRGMAEGCAERLPRSLA